MYIDFHTHAFADNIAERAIEKLEKTIFESGFPNPAAPVFGGTVKGLLEEMDKSGVDISVVMPIATKPSQQTVINNWAAEIKSEKLYPFGSVHPDAPDALEELERIKSLGLYGIKFHPDYQEFFADEERMFPIYEKCAALSLPVLLHAGLDPLSMDVVHCTPKMGANVADRVKGLTLIMAHLGGSERWDDVETYLVGKNVYLDTAYTAGYLPDEQILRIMRNHGLNRILFASDSPWHSPSDEMEMIKRLPLDKPEKDMIFYRNALEILRG
jgi:predicted TIM-barrel fold metal-dependent hydrolase